MKEREHIKWRRGRSIPFRWSIKIGGQVPELAEGEIKLFMCNSLGVKVAWPCEIEDGNVLVFDWLGKDQKRGGVYSFTALYHDGLDDQNVLDSCVDIELVESTCDENACCGCGDFSVEPVYMEGDFYIAGGGDTPTSAVLYTPQTLSSDQQSQARANINAKKGGYTRIEKLHDYIHEIWYDGVDYSFADLLPHTPLGGCTSIRKGKFFARNLDWKYSEMCEFFVHTPAVNGRHAVDGFGGNIPALTKEVVESGEWNEAYNWLPLAIGDGHNDAGLCCSMNVVPTKTAPDTYEKTTGTNPSKPTLNGLMIVRYILDNHTNALAAAEDISDNWNVVMPHTDTFDEELHFLIADNNSTYVLEFKDNMAEIIDLNGTSGHITNFRLIGTNLGEVSLIEPFGQGVERYHTAMDAFDVPSTIGIAVNNMRRLNYTRAYGTHVEAWRTEFAGLHDELTVQAAYDTPHVYDATLAAAHAAYLNRTRNGETWHTTHSVVYDIESGECMFLVQEDMGTTTRRDMVLPIDAYTKAETDALLAEKQDTLLAGTNITIAADGKTISVDGKIISNVVGQYSTNHSDWWDDLCSFGAVANFSGLASDSCKVGDLFIVKGKARNNGVAYIIVSEAVVPSGNLLRGKTVWFSRGYAEATEEKAGLMSADDKKKVNALIAGAQTYMFASKDLEGTIPTTKDLYIKCPKGAILSTDELRFYRQIKSKKRPKREDGSRFTQKIQKGWITPMREFKAETALRNVRLHFEKYEEGYDYWRVVPGLARYESLADVFADTYPRRAEPYSYNNSLRLYDVKCAIAVFREGTQITDYMTFSFGGEVYTERDEDDVLYQHIRDAQLIYK